MIQVKTLLSNIHSVDALVSLLFIEAIKPIKLTIATPKLLSMSHIKKSMMIQNLNKMG